MKSDWVTLDQLADVALGYKSLQNIFFYVNQKTIKTYGIESEFLVPICQLKELDGTHYLQDQKPSTYLFYCKDEERDLKGTGALRYIRAMADHAATEKKQAGKVATIKQVLEEQGGKVWYAPKATPHKSHIWIRKAFDAVFSPYLFETAQTIDQRCNRITVKRGVSWEALASVMSSSLFSMSIEVNGAASMGGGVLEAPTKKLRGFPIIDIRKLSEKNIRKLIQLGRQVWLTERPTDWRCSNRPSKKTQEFDEWLLAELGGPIRVKQLYMDLVETTRARFALAKDKQKTKKKKLTMDIAKVAKEIVNAVRKELEGKRFPEDFTDSGKPQIFISFEGHEHLLLEIGRFLTNSTLCIKDESGNELFDKQLPTSVVDLVVQALLMGRRTFHAPEDGQEANKVLDKFYDWIPKILEKVRRGIAESALGTGFENKVEAEVLRQLNFHEFVGNQILPAIIQIWAPFERK